MPDAFLDVGDRLAGVAFKPMPVEVFGDPPKLDNEVPDRSSGSASPRFSRQSRSRAGSSEPMMILASVPPMNWRRFMVKVSTDFRPLIGDSNTRFMWVGRYSSQSGVCGFDRKTINSFDAARQ